MGLVSELIVSVGVEGTQAVVDALKKVDGAQVELKDSASTSTKDMGKSWGDLTKDLDLSLIAIGSTVASVGAVIANFALDAANDWSDYNLEMEKGATATGLMVDEYSRLVQAADDAFVSQDSFTKALEMATKSGYPITIDSLGQIADKLNAIKDPAEKAKLATEIFGRGWADIMPFLTQGSAGIDQATEAIKDNMIATEESVNKSKAYASAVDDLTDAWTGFRNEVGGAVLPVLTDSMDLMMEQIDQAASWTNNTKTLEAAYKSGKITWIEYNKAMLRNTWDAEDGAKAIAELGLAQTVTNAAIKEGTSIGISSGNAYSYMIAQEKQANAAWAAQAAEIALVDAEYQKLSETLNTQLAQANINVSVQMASFREGVAGDLVTGLKDAGLAGDELVSRLKLIDQYAGTDYAIQYQMELKMPELLKTLIENPDQFLAAAQGFEDYFAPLTASVSAAQGAVGELEAQLEALEKEYTITITTILNDGPIKDYNPPDKDAYVNYWPRMSGANRELQEGSHNAIGGPVYPGNVYNWQEPGREGEILMPSQYGRVASSTEVAQMLREATRPGDGASAGKQAQIVNNNTTEVVVNATVTSDFDLDKLTREIVRKINA